MTAIFDHLAYVRVPLFLPKIFDPAHGRNFVITMIRVTVLPPDNNGLIRIKTLKLKLFYCKMGISLKFVFRLTSVCS